ncbi:MAG: hypothetical protein IKY67_06705 [Paludibacteraceae bacterium]|nr:hypothetical protein [Paludibacteraceae bacterium]
MAIKLTGKSGAIDLSKKMFKGDPGGYYIPDVKENGDLVWTPSEEEMPQVESSNIIGPTGPRGESGVYVGAAEPQEEEVLVWVNTEGTEVDELATKEYVNEALKDVEVDLTGYYTAEQVDAVVEEAVSNGLDYYNLDIRPGEAITAEDKAKLEEIFSRSNGVNWDARDCDFIVFDDNYGHLTTVTTGNFSLTLSLHYSLHMIQAMTVSFDSKGVLSTIRWPQYAYTYLQSQNVQVAASYSPTGEKTDVGAAIKYLADNQGNIDLSNYYNKEQVDEKIETIELTPGPQGEPGENGKDYVLTAEDKQEIANLVDTSGFTTEEDVIALIAEYGGGGGSLPASEEGAF